MTAEPIHEQPVHGHMVLLPTPPPGGFTVADLPRLAEAVDARFELIDGEVVMTAPATWWHDEVKIIIRDGLRGVAPEWAAVGSEKGVDLGNSAPEPDVLVVPRTAVTAASLTFAPADVHLAVEVVSTGAVTKDRKLRPITYAEAGIPNFWLAENEDDRIVVYTFELLPGRAEYAPTGVHRERLKVARPFDIDIELPEVTW